MLLEGTRVCRPPAIKLAADAAGPAAAEEPSQLSAPECGKTGCRALVAAVNPEMLRLCHGVLEGLGVAATAVDTGLGALILARQQLPDLILVDGQLRDVPGHEAVKWLRSDPDLLSTPVILLTTNGEPPRPIRQDPAPRKPVSAASLRRMICEAFK